MEVVECRPGVYACLRPQPASNAGFAVGTRGVLVIDTLASPPAGRQLASAVARETGSRVLLVANTHHHPDHVFGNQAFQAPVVAHCALAGELSRLAAAQLAPGEVSAWVAEHPEDRWLIDELELCYPNVVFRDELLIDLGSRRAIVKHTGGHTLDSSVLDLPEDQVLFAGDLVFEGRTPYLLDADFRATAEALRALERLGERTVVPGHGALCGMAYVGRFRGYLEESIEAACRLVEAGWSDAEILESGELPGWWTSDRAELQRANMARLLGQLRRPTQRETP